jgi:hypothetical protein
VLLARKVDAHWSLEEFRPHTKPEKCLRKEMRILLRRWNYTFTELWFKGERQENEFQRGCKDVENRGKIFTGSSFQA